MILVAGTASFFKNSRRTSRFLESDPKFWLPIPTPGLHSWWPARNVGSIFHLGILRRGPEMLLNHCWRSMANFDSETKPDLSNNMFFVRSLSNQTSFTGFDHLRLLMLFQPNHLGAPNHEHQS